MEVLHARCAGLDVSKKDAKVCVRVAGAGRRKTVETVTTWGSMTRQILALRDHLVDQRVTCAVMEATGDYWKPFRGFRELICTIPGISTLTADVIVAETGADMSRFPTAGHLASWAGTTPGKNESAGKVKSSKTRPGKPYLQGALGAAAMVCGQHPHTYYGARYRRIASRRGPKKANVAIQHSMLTAIWHMGTTGTLYDDPGADYFTRLNPNRTKKRAIQQLEAMGYRVTLNQAS